MSIEEMNLMLKSVRIRDGVYMQDQIKEIGISRLAFVNLFKGKNSTLMVIGKVIKYLKSHGYEIDNVEIKGDRINC